MAKSFLDLEYMQQVIARQEEGLKVKTGIHAGGGPRPLYMVPEYGVPDYGIPPYDGCLDLE